MKEVKRGKERKRERGGDNLEESAILLDLCAVSHKFGKLDEIDDAIAVMIHLGHHAEEIILRCHGSQ